MNQAWSTAVADPGDLCTKDGEFSSIVAGTDRGDVVRLEVNPCQQGLFPNWRPDEPAYRIRVERSAINAS